MLINKPSNALILKFKLKKFQNHSQWLLKFLFYCNNLLLLFLDQARANF